MTYEIIGVICLYWIVGIAIWNYIVGKLVRPWLQEDDSARLSVAVVKLGVFLSIGFSLGALYNPLDALQIILQPRYEGKDLYLEFGSSCSIFVLVLFLGTAATFVISVLLYWVLCRPRNIFVAIGNNKLAAALLFIGIYLSLTISLLSGMEIILDGFVPYPTIPVYR